MSTDLFEQALGIPKPTCCSQGDCCRAASPSVPFGQLLQRAATDDDFARGFFSMMVPHLTIEAAREASPGLVERAVRAAQNSGEFANGEADLAFYRCRYLKEDNRCGIYEDRPQFCRDYPNSPYVVFAPGCAYEDWAMACREKFSHMKQELARLKHEQAELHQVMAERGLRGPHQ